MSTSAADCDERVSLMSTRADLAKISTNGKNWMEKNVLPHCSDPSKYALLIKIGHGTFGEVYKGRDRQSNKIVALKKLIVDDDQDCLPITAMREIQILRLLCHENVINLVDICRTKTSANNLRRPSYYLVLEFCEHDLAGMLLKNDVRIELGEIKKIMQQLLNGLSYIHGKNILHRDVKTANILINKNGVLKLADFGLSRAYSSNGKVNRYTNRVVTLWYRAPELLLGDQNYGPPVDMWGAGCILAELFTRSAIFPGNSDQQQIKYISKLCGTITPDIWPEVQKLDLYSKIKLPTGFKRCVKERLRPFIKDFDACDLVDKLLILNPNERFGTHSALNHDFFYSAPAPCDLGRLMSRYSESMFVYTHQQASLEKRNQVQGEAYQDRIY